MESRHLGISGCLKKLLGPEHVCAKENAWIHHSSAVVGFRSEIDNKLGSVLLEKMPPQVVVSNVAFDEKVAIAVLLSNVGQVFEIPRIRQEIVIDRQPPKLSRAQSSRRE